MKIIPFALALGLLPALAQAQPFSTSMAECAASHQNAAQWVESDEAVTKLMYAFDRWFEAAVAQAENEGITDAAAVILALVDDKTSQWEDKGMLVFTTEEFRDWMDYCRAFAKDRGIQTVM